MTYLRGSKRSYTYIHDFEVTAYFDENIVLDKIFFEKNISIKVISHCSIENLASVSADIISFILTYPNKRELYCVIFDWMLVVDPQILEIDR